MSLGEQMSRYTELSGNDGVHTPIGIIGAYLDGYEKGKTDAQQWIPVSSGKLPEKYIGEWLCCTDDGNIMILPYDTPGDGSKECVFYYWEDDYTVVKPNVVAWMPLPESYRGE